MRVLVPREALARCSTPAPLPDPIRATGGRCAIWASQTYAAILAAESGDTTLSSSSVGTVNVTNTWFEQTVTYTSLPNDGNAGQTLKIKLVKDTNVRQLDWDDVRLNDSRVLTCQGFLPPFTDPLTLKKKENRAIPVKMVLRDLFGAAITNADLSKPPVVQVTLDGAGQPPFAGYTPALLPGGLSDDGNQFRYDPTAGQWIINLGTKQFTASGTYSVKLRLVMVITSSTPAARKSLFASNPMAPR